MATALTAMSARPTPTQSNLMAPHAPETVNAKLVPTKNLEHKATLTASRADETLYTVKCYWDKDPEKWQPNSAVIYNGEYSEEGYYEPYDDEGNELDINYIEVKVPAGTYDIMTSFYGLKYNNLFQDYVTDFNAYVIKQNVTVSGDMELKFDPATATNAYTYEPKTPEGELFCPSEYYVTEDWQFTLKNRVTSPAASLSISSCSTKGRPSCHMTAVIPASPIPTTALPEPTILSVSAFSKSRT